MNSDKPLKHIIVLLALCMGMTLIASLFGAALAFMGVDINATNTLIVVQSVSSILVFAVPVILLAAIYRFPARTVVHPGGPLRWADVLAAVAIMLLLNPAYEWIATLNDNWHWSGSWSALEEQLRQISEAAERILNQILQRPSVGALLTNLLVVAVLPAICEELFFRCGLQQLLTRWLRNPHWAIIIAAAIFSLAHGEVFAFLPRFVMGIVLGYLFYTTGSIAASACAHFANNALVVVMYYLYANGAIAIDPSQSLGIGTFVTVACALAALLLFFTSSGHKLVSKQSH